MPLMAARISERVRDFHEALLEAGCGGKTILRSDAEKLLMERWDVGISAARLYIDTGRGLGLWTLTGEPRGGKGALQRSVTFGPPGLLVSVGQ